jgi:hypothetical protein
MGNRDRDIQGRKGNRRPRAAAVLLIAIGVILVAAAVSLGKNGPSTGNYQFAVDSSGTGAPPGQACKGVSKEHAAGAKGTPFSQCVTDAAHSRGSKGH